MHNNELLWIVRLQSICSCKNGFVAPQDLSNELVMARIMVKIVEMVTHYSTYTFHTFIYLNLNSFNIGVDPYNY